MSKVYMMVTITNRNKRKDFRTFFKRTRSSRILGNDRERDGTE